jgi:methylglutaconyl-CoA hydratase
MMIQNYRRILVNSNRCVNNSIRRYLSTSDNIILLNKCNNTNIATISLNRFDGKNSLSNKMINELKNAIDNVNVDNNIRALILTSTVQGIFCAGADLKERLTMPDDQVEEFVSKLRSTFTDIENLPFPTIAAIEGVALGGGLELALACDIRIGGSKAILGLPETSLAIIPGAGGTQRLPRLLGIAKAKELIFLSKRLTAADALSIGLINEMVESENVLKKATEIAKEISEKGPIAQRMAKLAIDKGIHMSMNDALIHEKKCYSGVVKTHDRKEGLLAFKEKRKPIYLNK